MSRLEFEFYCDHANLVSDYHYIRNKKGPKSLNVLPPEEHATRRRLWNRGMSSESLAEYEAMIARRATQLMDKLSKGVGPINIMTWLDYFSCVDSVPSLRLTCF